MENEPNRVNTSFFTPFLIAKIVISALVKSIIMLVLFVYYAKTYDSGVAGSLMFIFLIGNELLYSLSCRNLKCSVLNKDIFSNKRLSFGLVGLLIVQVLVLTTGLSKFFVVDNIGVINIVVVLGICLLLFVIGEVVKPLYAKLFKDYTEVKDNAK